ncbi:MAG: bifunctional phosphopantothenoylcysteine decarboxylase/phosphopantothenate--cysteine ligase CoaBC [Chloroflexi bacterium]|nr:MAG: bifunctional phosphopantothenoylcysteine decarboxylase/phosphopantothenate--cysteine ligase CoaBC [Chloroflexota bacterium]
MAETRALEGRRIAVYVSGSVAAYKAASVVTALRKQGAEVRVAMTAAGARFISPITMQSLSGHPVATSLWDEPAAQDAGHGMTHLALAAWAELQVAVPASADLIARLALGLADDAVTATALACRAPLLLAPAMESEMWSHPATQSNLDTLRGRGAVVVGPTSGRLASGDEGPGRMVEPDEVVAAVPGVLPGVPAGARWLDGERVVVTAGGTREPIDPVRYVGNRSSGKMGNALTDEALRLGGRVILVTAAPPPPPRHGLTVVEVGTADEMLAAVRAHLAGAAVLVMAAAVADYRPAQAAQRKIKKRDDPFDLALVPAADILHALRDDDARRGAIVVGFAAETDNLLANATAKLAEKRLDLIVANDVSSEGIGMATDDNAVTIIGRDGVVAEVSRAPKREIARAVFAAVHALHHRR